MSDLNNNYNDRSSLHQGVTRWSLSSFFHSKYTQCTFCHYWGPIWPLIIDDTEPLSHHKPEMTQNLQKTLQTSVNQFFLHKVYWGVLVTDGQCTLGAWWADTDRDCVVMLMIRMRMSARWVHGSLMGQFDCLGRQECRKNCMRPQKDMYLFCGANTVSFI